MTKKIFSAILAIIMLLVFSSCQSSTKEDTEKIEEARKQSVISYADTIKEEGLKLSMAILNQTNSFSTLEEYDNQINCLQDICTSLETMAKLKAPSGYEDIQNAFLEAILILLNSYKSQKITYVMCKEAFGGYLDSLKNFSNSLIELGEEILDQEILTAEEQAYFIIIGEITSLENTSNVDDFIEKLYALEKITPPERFITTHNKVIKESKIFIESYDIYKAFRNAQYNAVIDMEEYLSSGFMKYTVVSEDIKKKVKSEYSDYKG